MIGTAIPVTVNQLAQPQQLQLHNRNSNNYGTSYNYMTTKMKKSSVGKASLCVYK